MNSKSILLALVALVLLPFSAAQAASIYDGKYEAFNRDANKSVKIQVKEKDGKYNVSFQPANPFNPAAPKGDGRGALEKDGTLSFMFVDNFGNKGEGTISTNGDIFFIKWDMDRVQNPATLVFYEKMKMKKKK